MTKSSQLKESTCEQNITIGGLTQTSTTSDPPCVSRAKESDYKSPLLAKARDDGIIICQDTRQFRVVFTIVYSDLGFEQLYDELAAHKTEIERTKHIERCLHDIVRRDFKRPAPTRNEMGEHDQGSFRIQLRFSPRDVGLEAIYKELLPIPTMFKRKNVLRRKLYDAFNTHFSIPPEKVLCAGYEQADAKADLPQQPIQPIQPIQHAMDAPSHSMAATEPTAKQSLTLEERRKAAQQANSGQFDLAPKIHIP